MMQLFFVCLASGLILLGAEVLVPGGILGAFGGLLLLVSIVSAFSAFPNYGPYVAVSVLALLGVILYWWITVFPNSRLGKRLIPGATLKAAKAAQPGLETLLGAEGQAATALRPCGFATIGGRRIDVITRGELITSGENVRVVSVEGNRVVVSRSENKPPA